MKSFNLLICFIIMALAAFANAETPLECPYVTIKGDYVGLYYFPAINRGQQHIDYGQNTDKVCIQRASCDDGVTYKTKLEKCGDFTVTCANKHTFEGEFPACCVKC